ncbi:hypothetical protein [Brevibacillus laterosporus]|uniref:hypothetical protein n=1 Tax=Brevibacillus laterosporus TaxID=1465 RepID=UPI000E6CDE4C|nr:hypothetical protein [Brevibacillus laterosporus]AYB40999.1 hypothetical protein D5F52_23690 [Brevibacillus laterosporus]MBM7106827.1 hypothetical protein [Brevibacillus laterosporus]
MVMKMRHWSAGMLLIGLLAGCTPVASPNELLKAPTLNENQEEVKKAVLANLPQGSSLMIPRNNPGENGAIIEKDLNGDGSNEVVAFYKSGEYNLGFIVMQKTGNSWQKVGQIEETGQDVDYVAFEDVSGDKEKEIFVSWMASEDVDKEFGGYKWKDGQMIQILKTSCKEALVGDLDKSGISKAYVFKLDRDKMKAPAEVYQYDKAISKMKMVQQLELDWSINGYENVLLGKATSEQNGIFLDSGVGAHSGQTALLVNNKDKLTQVDLTNYDNVTFKPYSTFSKDVNNDGIIEISTLVQPVGAEDLSMVDTPWITEWYQWNGQKSLIKVKESYDDVNNGFQVNIPNYWFGHYTVKLVTTKDAGTITFLYVDSQGKPSAELFTIDPIKKTEWPNTERELKLQRKEYGVIDENGEHVFIVRFPTDMSRVPANEQSTYRKMLFNLQQVQEVFRKI